MDKLLRLVFIISKNLFDSLLDGRESFGGFNVKFLLGGYKRYFGSFRVIENIHKSMIFPEAAMLLWPPVLKHQLLPMLMEVRQLLLEMSKKKWPNPANQEILSKYELFKISDENSRDYRCLEHVNCLGVSKECIKQVYS